MRAAVFLDRDGVIIVNREDYVKRWEEVEYIEGALESLARLAAADLPVVIVTNQSAVGRGILTCETVHQIQQRMIDEIEARGGRIVASYICPHHPEAGCDCRKPAPGMLRQAAREHGIDLQSSYLVGDALTDIEAAEAAGAAGILVLTGRGASQAARLPGDRRAQLPIVSDLSAAVDYILRRQEKAG